MSRSGRAHLIQPLSVIFVLAGVGISHVRETLRAEGGNVWKAHFGAAREDRVADCEVSRVVDADDIARVGRLRTTV